MPQLTFQERDEAVTAVLVDGKQVGVITARNGQIGFRIFGEPIGGSAHSVEEAKKAIEKHYH